MAQLELDNMEYSSDALAQAAYVTDAGVDSYTKLLLHLDNNVTDSEMTPKTVTNNNVTFSDTVKKWGYSGVFNGTTAYLTVPDSEDFDFGSGDFTLECYVNLSAEATTHGIVSQGDSFFGDRAFVFALDKISGNNYNFYVSYSIDGTNNIILTRDAGIFTLGTFYHIALVRNGPDLRLFKDGTQIGATYNIGTSIIFNSSGTFNVGMTLYNASLYYLFNGYIDEIRISKGIARWTSNFTPPTSQYAGNLTSYSESTIKTQGSYSLKGVASITDSLNKTLTKTFATNQNLTGVKNLKFDIRASRTGSNIKIGIHDTGGTTTEITPNIITVDTWQTVSWNLSGVSDANKDAIDKIIVTIVNADSENTFYLDYAEIAQAIDVFGIVG
jgi:hypothetical protein